MEEERSNNVIINITGTAIISEAIRTVTERSFHAKSKEKIKTGKIENMYASVLDIKSYTAM
jgi:hypothetical protein